MIVHSAVLDLRTQGFSDCLDITPQIEESLTASGVVDGLVTIMNPGSTGAITTIEFESGALEDLRRALDVIAPMDGDYAHNLRWGDGNGFAHVRSALMKPSLSVPALGGKLCLGRWQQVVFVDFDNKPRNRRIVVQVIGNGKEQPTAGRR
jgi:secondary thiamine-phosphate synthase enzyme